MTEDEYYQQELKDKNEWTAQVRGAGIVVKGPMVVPPPLDDDGSLADPSAYEGNHDD